MFQNPKDLLHFYITQYVKPGDTVIDATVGNGHDTCLLLDAVGECGRVVGFDIQEQAITRTHAATNGRAELYLASHSAMQHYVQERVRCVIFNLGYLPGGDHGKSTTSETTIAALSQALELILPDGFVFCTIYHGGDSGFAERDAVLEFLGKLDYKRFTALRFDYVNRPNYPPIPVVIQRRIGGKKVPQGV